MLNWIILGIACAVLIYLGVRSSRIASDDDEAGFLIAGKTLGPFVGACTLIATAFSGWCFMGSPGVAYHYGTIEILANFFFAPAAVIAILFFASFLRKRADAMGSYTIPEYVAQRHGKDDFGRLLQGTAALITIILLLVFLTSQIKAVGLLCSSWLGISLNTAALLMIVLIIVYTMLGGLAAVALTDTVMIIGMMAATVYVMVHIFSDVSVTEMISRLNEIDPQLVNPDTAKPYGNFKSAAFLILPYAFLFAAVLPYMAIRFLAFKPDVKFHTVAMYAAPFGCILSLIPIVGLYVRISAPALETADKAMPYYLSNFLPPAIAGLITLCILFAMKSTANSLLHTVSSAVSYDLRNAFYHGKKFSPKKALAINRIAVAVLGLTGFMMMIFAPPFFLSWLGILGTGTLLASMIGPVFISTFWQGNGYGAMASMLGGFFVSGSMLLFSDAGWVVGPLTGSLVGVTLYFVVSSVTFGIQPRTQLKTVKAVKAA
ncbi:sodium:solute symporter family protein [Candidatus Peregrinibacteria bacterium]|jgi:sodium/pantothenate symporter|nr:sodium:solute symporter family protein [Deltaproteobacteria bacterium]MBT7484261.1 sodium:solute symporter family protein [Candidatus Peregrinibacteria bacterium]